MTQSTRKGDKLNYLLKHIKRESYFKECFHDDENCSSSIISAHSIQNNRILNKISKNGEVLYFSMNKGEGDLNFVLAPVGRKKATTFTGFCGSHDTKIFSPIEISDYREGNKEQEFLFAYRALAKEYHAKKEAFNTAQSVKENINYCNYDLETYLKSSNDALSDIEKERQLFNTALDNQEFDIIRTRVIVFQEEYHIAVSSVFTMEKDMNGKVINDLRLNVSPKLFYITVFPQNGKTFVLISYLRKYAKHLNATITFIAKSTVKDRKVIISNLIAAHVENVVFSPIRWEQMAESQKLAFQSLFNETIHVVGDKWAQQENTNIFI